VQVEHPAERHNCLPVNMRCERTEELVLAAVAVRRPPQRLASLEPGDCVAPRRRLGLLPDCLLVSVVEGLVRQPLGWRRLLEDCARVTRRQLLLPVEPALQLQLEGQVQTLLDHD